MFCYFVQFCGTSVLFVRFSHICFYLKLFKLPLEKEEQVGGPILAQEEMKTIFGSIPEIYDVHMRIKVACPRLSIQTKFNVCDDVFSFFEGASLTCYFLCV